MVNPRVAVLASGEGTTAEAVQKAWLKKPEAPRIALIICNNPDAGILKRLPDIESVLISGRTHPGSGAKRPGEQTDAEEQAIIDRLIAGNFDAVWLAGYMKKIGPRLVQQFGWRKEYKSPYQAMMLNTHPGLLPETKGLMGIDVQVAVLKEPLPKAGHTLHIVSKDYDEGPVVAEHKIKVERGDTAEILFERVKASERAHLSQDIEGFIIERRRLLDGR